MHSILGTSRNMPQTMYKNWPESDHGTFAVTKPGILQFALPQGLTTAGAAPGLVLLLFQGLGR